MVEPRSPRFTSRDHDEARLARLLQHVLEHAVADRAEPLVERDLRLHDADAADAGLHDAQPELVRADRGHRQAPLGEQVLVRVDADAEVPVLGRTRRRGASPKVRHDRDYLAFLAAAVLRRRSYS